MQEKLEAAAVKAATADKQRRVSLRQQRRMSARDDRKARRRSVSRGGDEAVSTAAADGSSEDDEEEDGGGAAIKSIISQFGNLVLQQTNNLANKMKAAVVGLGTAPTGGRPGSSERAAQDTDNGSPPKQPADDVATMVTTGIDVVAERDQRARGGVASSDGDNDGNGDDGGAKHDGDDNDDQSSSSTSDDDDLLSRSFAAGRAVGAAPVSVTSGSSPDRQNPSAIATTPSTSTSISTRVGAARSPPTHNDTAELPAHHSHDGGTQSSTSGPQHALGGGTTNELRTEGRRSDDARDTSPRAAAAEAATEEPPAAQAERHVEGRGDDVNAGGTATADIQDGE